MAEDPTGSFSTPEETFLRFLIVRTVHDLGNDFAGILSLSEFHLQQGVADANLEESLRAIEESASKAREFLVNVSSLLQIEPGAESYVRLKEVALALERFCALTLPRNVTVEVAENAVDGIVEVDQAALIRHFLIAAAAELEAGSVVAKIRISTKEEEDLIWLIYESDIRHARSLKTWVTQIFSPLSSDGSRFRCEEGPGKFVIALAFPEVEFS